MALAEFFQTWYFKVFYSDEILPSSGRDFADVIKNKN